MSSAYAEPPHSIPGYAVFGHPIAHSLSPRIHRAFAQQTGTTLTYEAIDAPADTFIAQLQAFAASGGRGANVTLPLKEAAASLCTSLSERAALAGAVNTLIREGDGWRGDNTDGAGLLRDLQDRQGIDLRERRTLLMGAGGAARGVVPALLDAGIGELYLVNRTSARADALMDAIGQPERVHSRYYDDLDALGEFSLIINATSAARHGGLPTLPRSVLAPRCACVDLNYGEAAIPFLAWARAHQAHDAVDGLGMLVEQAAESFALWHRVRPDTDGVYAELRARDAVLVTAD